jgi:hypothetical protein
MLSVTNKPIMLSVIILCVMYAECPKQTLYVECHYAECHYAECRGAALIYPNHRYLCWRATDI